jgi:hypothetical protein
MNKLEEGRVEMYLRVEELAAEEEEVLLSKSAGVDTFFALESDSKGLLEVLAIERDLCACTGCKDPLAFGTLGRTEERRNTHLSQGVANDVFSPNLEEKQRRFELIVRERRAVGFSSASHLQGNWSAALLAAKKTRSKGRKRTICLSPSHPNNPTFTPKLIKNGY